MDISRITDFVHSIIKIFANNQKVFAIDATVGNGNDSLFLSQLYDIVFGFDIQELAISNSKKLLEKNGKDNVRFILDSHENIKNYCNNVDLVLFNLGYLPGADRDKTTKVNSTLKAIKNSLEILTYLGVVVVVSYRGHKEGKEEYNQIKEYVKKLNYKEYKVVTFDYSNSPNNPPVIFVIQKIEA